MTTVETTYDIGDVVFGVQTVTARRRPWCQLCEGGGSVKIEGSELRAVCPACHGRRYEPGDDHAAIQERATIRRLTIGSVAWDSAAGASYMAEETGVGSGTRWPEDRLFALYENARADCEDAVVVFGFLAPGEPNVQTVIRGTKDEVDWEPFAG